MTYNKINAAYSDLQGYYIEMIEEVCNGQDQIEVNLVDERDIMLAEGGYLPEMDGYYSLKWDEGAQGYYLCWSKHADFSDEFEVWNLEHIGVDGLRDILQAITK